MIRSSARSLLPIAFIGFSLSFVLVDAEPRTAHAESSPVEIVVVSSGDDDGDGIADRDDDSIANPASGLEIKLAAKHPTALENTVDGVDLALFNGPKRLQKGTIDKPSGPFRLQAREPGRHEVDVFGAHHTIGALLVSAVDGRGRAVDLAKSHASIERTPPRAAVAHASTDPAMDDDPDALRFVVTGFPDDLPTTLTLSSTQTLSDSYRPPAPLPPATFDLLRAVPLVATTCPSGTKTGLACVTTPMIRTVMDDLDRQHPLSSSRSIKVELGGLLAIALGDRPAQIFMHVGGPRDTALGTIDRLRAVLRVRLVRLGKGGPPPVGENDRDAIERVRDEIDRANMIWAACGVSFGPRGAADVKVVDPPASFLLAVGCDVGAPASGGKIQFQADQKQIEVDIDRGTLPAGAARVVAHALEHAGFHVTTSDSAAIGAATYGTTDVLVRRSNGDPAQLSPVKSAKGVGPESAKLSSDPTLPVCIGRVDLDDGLSHFTDANAIAGTLEERTLIKAFDDGDPSTIELYVVPSFGGDSRIGESFIFADAGAIKDVVVEDRGGFRADRASFTLAHELGHVLLDQPGHPDDFGVDTPTRLMDADAVNASAFGPRRLEIAECERVLRQSGPSSPPHLLVPWPTQPHVEPKPK